MTPKKGYILVIDDNPQIGELVTVALSILPEYVVQAALTGEDALIIAMQAKPVLIISDIDLGRSGRLNGIVVIWYLQRVFPDVPILALSIKDVLRGEAMAAGVNEWLGKPFSPLQLVKIVERLLSGN